jgi:signal transduction histidine kinase
MDETSTFRRTAASLTIGSFSLAALMGIVALLTGGSFGEGEGRILLTTLIVGCASICMLCYLATSGTPWAGAGAVGALVLVVPVATSLILTWTDWDLFDSDSETLLKTFGVGVVAAVTLAQICMLLALAGGRPSLGFVLWSTVVLAVVLALLVSSLILGQTGADDLWRLLGVLAILDVLGTLVTIALARFGAHKGVPARADGHDARTSLRVTLSDAQAEGIEELAHRTGRQPAELVAEAVDRYLRPRD